VIDFAALAAEVHKLCSQKEQPKGGRPPHPIETRVRIVGLKRLYGRLDEQMEFQLLDRTSFKRLEGLEHSRAIPDRTTIWLFENVPWTSPSRLCPHPDGCVLHRSAHGVACEVGRTPLVRTAHSRGVPKAAVGRKNRGTRPPEAAKTGVDRGSLGKPRQTWHVRLEKAALTPAADPPATPAMLRGRSAARWWMGRLTHRIAHDPHRTRRPCSAPGAR